MKTLLTLTACAAATLAMSITAASAKPGDYRFTVAKDDLQTRTGIGKTVRRLERFAESHCGFAYRQSLSDRKISVECIQDITHNVITKLDVAPLTAHYYQHSNYAKILDQHPTAQ